VSAFDAALIARYAVGLVNDPLSAAGQWFFAPVSRSYDHLMKEVEAQDYSGSIVGDVSQNWGGAVAPGRTGHVLDVPDTLVAPYPARGIDLPLVCRAEAGILSAEFVVEYDPSVLGFDGAAPGEAGAGFQTLYDPPAAGKVNVAVFGPLPAEKAGCFAVLRFMPARPGISAPPSISWRSGSMNVRPGSRAQIRGFGAGEMQETALESRLIGNSPNPFNSGTEAHFEIALRGRVTLEVRDARGRRVRLLLNGWLDSGRHSRTWDGRNEAGRRPPPGSISCG